jgi:hypothetical protein
MAFEVLRTPQVRDAVQRQMSRTERASYDAARDELGGRGCVAGGYKLASTDGGDYPLCARHLANAWRMYTESGSTKPKIKADPPRRALVEVGFSRPPHSTALPPLRVLATSQG